MSFSLRTPSLHIMFSNRVVIASLIGGFFTSLLFAFVALACASRRTPNGSVSSQTFSTTTEAGLGFSEYYCYPSILSDEWIGVHAPLLGRKSSISTSIAGLQTRDSWTFIPLSNLDMSVLQAAMQAEMTTASEQVQFATSNLNVEDASRRSGVSWKLSDAGFPLRWLRVLNSDAIKSPEANLSGVRLVLYDAGEKRIYLINMPSLVMTIVVFSLICLVSVMSMLWLRGVRRINRGQCLRCGYLCDGTRCPECGEGAM